MVTPWSLFSNLTTSQSLWAGYEAVTKGLGGNMWGGFENGVHSGSQNGGLLIVRYALYFAQTSKQAKNGEGTCAFGEICE